jgi:uncharacterized protein (DUF488 family)
MENRIAALRIWTIGHSNLDWPTFSRHLASVDIAVVADVRSYPVSRYPHFCRAALKDRLNASGVAYVFLGRELGGRPRHGAPADYEAMAKTPLFLEGLSCVEQIAGRARLALLCSEHEPLCCHRCLLVGRALVERGASVEHILRDGRAEPHPQTEERLLDLVRQTEVDLFAPRAERLSRAYRAQELRLRRATDGTRRKPS